MSSYDINEAFREQFNTQIFQSMETDPPTTQTFVAFGSIIQAVVLTLIISNTARYFEVFGRKDKLYLRVGVALGSALACASFAVHCWLLHRMIHNAHDNMVGIWRTDALCMWAYVLVGGVYSLVATSFYSVRIWMMSRRRWWTIPPLACCVLTAFGMMVPTVIWGLGMPQLEFKNVRVFPRYFSNSNVALVRWYGGVTLVSDAVISFTMINLLLSTQNAILQQQSQRGILHRIIAMLLESMVPPVIALTMILGFSFRQTGLIGWMRLPLCALPMLYYHSLLFSLVSRQTGGRIWDNIRESELWLALDTNIPAVPAPEYSVNLDVPPPVPPKERTGEVPRAMNPREGSRRGGGGWHPFARAAWQQEDHRGDTRGEEEDIAMSPLSPTRFKRLSKPATQSIENLVERT